MVTLVGLVSQEGEGGRVLGLYVLQRGAQGMGHGLLQ